MTVNTQTASTQVSLAMSPKQDEVTEIPEIPSCDKLQPSLILVRHTDTVPLV